MKLISDDFIFSGSFGVVWIIEINDPDFRQEWSPSNNQKWKWISVETHGYLENLCLLFP